MQVNQITNRVSEDWTATFLKSVVSPEVKNFRTRNEKSTSLIRSAFFERETRLPPLPSRQGTREPDLGKVF